MKNNTIQIIEAPDNTPTVRGNYQIFLAGGISKCRDWQAEIIEKIKNSEHIKYATIFNPRRNDYPVNDPVETLTQIKWEYNHLHFGDVIIFWFSPETLNPITLYELGKWGLSNDNKHIIIGIDPEYARKEDVEIQTKLARPDVTIVDSLDKIIEQLKHLFSPKYKINEA